MDSAPDSVTDSGAPPGTIAWVQVFTTDEPGDLMSDAAHVAIAQDGSILISGHFSGPTQFGTHTATPTGTGTPVFVAKLDRGGAASWVKALGNNGAILPMALAVTDAGDALVGLQTGGGTVTLDGISTTDNSTGAFGSSMFELAGMDGKAKWAYGFATANATTTCFIDGIAAHGSVIAVSNHFQGAVQIVGPSSTGNTIGSTGQDILITVHDDAQSGKIPSFRVLGGAGSDQATSIATDGSSIFFAGNFASTISYLGLTVANGPQNTFVAKVDKMVGKLWAANIGGQGGMTNVAQPYAIATDGTTGLYVVGGLWGYTNFNSAIPMVATAGGEDGFLAKINPADGTIAYARAIGGSSDDVSLAIATGPSQAIALAGYYQSSGVSIGNSPLPAPQPMKQAGFVARAMGAGTYTWAKGAAGPNAADYVRAGGVAIDPADGSVVVAGTFSGQVDFGDGKMRASSSAGKHPAFYVMKITP